MKVLDFFKVEKISESITRIFGTTGELMYLAQGNNKAALIDTGTGVGNLCEYVKELTDKPIVVIITHGHVDHASGAPNFEEVYMNHADDEVYKEHIDFEVRKGYVQAQYRDFDKIIESDYVQPKSSSVYKELREGDTFDLGGITLEIYNAAGHTKGQMAVLFKEDRILMTGDAANQATFLFDKYSLGITSYEKSMKDLLSKTEGKFDKILLSHGTGDAPKELLENIISLCEDIKTGNSDDIPFDFMGQRAYIAKKANEKFERIDGKFGNIIYSKEKVNK
ncbi:glyoxylase-like metal-dependent hydrolase (beta-lactamase superfamily II) [Clostridium saccharoperbutylacetonicum]|uniref:Zn-dependent hydrolase n=1 Tax=Clostridium saccharoperbutylacetonicum N1-4(HMT) TaxID=931276 RepID=M1MK41_9CLOT|nr:MBL fold metallo-hydrolase [Clostridium saccharoperbutylacetonicum]AGF56668.1 Zn-dependent hydrolase [Clostridium saccharoperbutylacetonicum N1-4(HMT)]NRT62577.1 glyoxylase-like metal-dependent hydrolase (beta-lactamase superfamily II) [Clostridium saccharoperbutylacetonicum]NSB25925.1 glyoxylase-like metal-dependent hydrolase (beta-lactamase superfamily II) [Clostridium saccharoperbutylacetonicum]NSB45283.1 glyoxylase-like metal-dependent hydrolase (beta-lactamase superfamily II) [Clostridi